MNYFHQDSRNAYDAQAEAQRIAFGPITFQATRILRDSGILERVQHSGTAGSTLEQVAAQVPLPRYAVKVLLEAGLGIGLFCLEQDRFRITKLGHVILRDPMTRANMDFMHDVCYRAFAHLDESLQQSRPAGLRSLGDWPTFYEGLAALPQRVRQSWLTFDHYYSDLAFPAALPLVFADRPKRLLDVGGNTGKWALACARFDPQVQVTIADLPQQLELARPAIRQAGLDGRIEFLTLDLLDPAIEFPQGFDTIWMSQFLDCFSEEQVVGILRRAAEAMTAQSRLHILELFWDRQPNETAAFCLQQTSLYFACIANGNSQMYHSADVLRCVQASGLEVEEQRDEVGQFHTWLKCRKARA